MNIHANYRWFSGHYDFISHILSASSSIAIADGVFHLLFTLQRTTKELCGYFKTLRGHVAIYKTTRGLDIICHKNNYQNSKIQNKKPRRINY